MWFWIVVAVLLVLAIAAARRRPSHRAVLRGLRRHFPRIARLRLVAACPGLDDVLSEAELRVLLDWILIELCRRTGCAGFDELMAWAARTDQDDVVALTAEVSRAAVERLPRPALGLIDGCEGRRLAAVIVDQSLTEAGGRVRAEADRPAS